jgi:riboflavin kinase, archaea type
MRIKGKVVKGMGTSGSFLSIGWVDRQLREKLGFLPFQGTLNIALDDVKIQGMLKEKCTERLVAGAEGFCDAVLIKGRINDRYECGVLIPLVEKYDERLVEIVAAERLKETLHIDDGDEVTLDVDIEREFGDDARRRGPSLD